MDALEYRHLAARYAEMAQDDPIRYRRSLRRFALLGRWFPIGFAVLVIAALAALVVFAVSAGGGAGILLLKLGLIAVPLAFLTLRSGFVRVRPPDGVAATRRDAPQLHAMIDELVAAADTAAPDHVLVVGDFNAAVAEVPRAAMIGGFRRYLILGLPLMAALSPDELRSVVAHELGHVSGRHGREGVLVYRVFEGWRRIWEGAAERTGTGPLMRFGRWYLPLLEARSFALRRQQELEADDFSRELVGGDVCARALLRITGEAGRSQRVAQEVWLRNLEAGDAREGYVQTLLAELRRPLERPDRARLYLAQELLAESDSCDEHPSLAHRLRRFGTPVAVRPSDEGMSLDEAVDLLRVPVSESAAGRYLEPQLALRVATRLDAEGRTETAASIDDARQHDAELARIEHDVTCRDSESAQEHRLLLSRMLRPREVGQQLSAELHARFPDNPRFAFEHASFLLSDGEEGGVELLERSMQLDPDATVGACTLLRAWHVSRGEFAEAAKAHDRIQSRERAQEAAAIERRDLADNAPLHPHGLPDPVQASLRGLAERDDLVRRVHVARLGVQHLPDEPAWLVGIELRDTGSVDGESFVGPWFEAMAPVELGVSSTTVVLLRGGTGGGHERITSTPGCLVYDVAVDSPDSTRSATSLASGRAQIS